MYIHNFLEFLSFQSCQLITVRQNAKIRVILGSVYTGNNTWQFWDEIQYEILILWKQEKRQGKSGDLEQGTDKVPMKPLFFLAEIPTTIKKKNRREERTGQKEKNKGTWKYWTLEINDCLLK